MRTCVQIIFSDCHDNFSSYVNDLNTLGGLDGVFDAEGRIRTLPVLAGYAAYQHWWSDSMRSSFLFSGVWVDNYSFLPDDSYHHTQRLTGNFIYSPIPRLNMGVELLWGKRTNEDGQSGSALQTQISGKFRF